MDQFKFSDRFQEMALGEEDNQLSTIRKSKEADKINIIDMVNSNPIQSGLIFPMEVISHNLDSKSTSTYNPNPKGQLQARKAISNFFHSKQVKVDPADLLLTASTSESYSFLFKLLTNPGDEVLVPSPGYPLFSFLTEFENINAIDFPLYEAEKGKWQYNLESMKSKVSKLTRAVIIVSPANPTGSFLSKSDWTLWMQWSLETQIPLIIDEVFSSYFFDESDFFYPSSTEAPVFILNGISKLLALPQLKLGWIHVNGNLSFKERALAGLELLSDTYLSVNEPVQNILPELLKWSPMIQNQIRNRIRRNLAAASEIFSDNENINWISFQAGWYGLIELNSLKFENSEVLAELVLDSCNVYTHPGEWYGFKPERLILVMSLIVSEDQFLAGLKELTSFLK
ncbi:pyridoxal phosphate-dependent aminotransferase [Leptospira ognonensis]|uniref:Pyridoxal phosphate-dependent aminotransferase n=1 Tax=Leptospira ognonensis TaxID=2484945 RepID=A0A4R9K4C2_9LEPT|nr:pyridoxal phosphate-dependent aminotransferase [Leptospira ognonensis]TGL60306.1 pyridoxal phosphate-dependent aminotransferase [Leptospira ognonensis]